MLAVVFRSLGGKTGEDVWLLPLEGERKPRPLIATRFDEMAPTLSPDGKWTACRSDESGRYEIQAQSFPGLERKLRVRTAGASRSREENGEDALRSESKLVRRLGLEPRAY